MKQDEIIEMARQAGIIAIHTEGDGHWHQQFIALKAFAKLVAAKERKACAEICDAEQKKNEDKGQWMWEAKLCGIAIRARGEK